jgi:hypothetical protein
VGWVHVVDVPEPAPWVRPGQLVLTTGYAWPRKAPALRRFAEELAAGSAAVAPAVPQFLDLFPSAHHAWQLPQEPFAGAPMLAWASMGETFPEPALSVLARAGVALAFSSDAPVVREVSPLKGALAAGRPLMGRGIPLERALFYYTRPEASALPPARLWPGERADLVVFDRDPLEHPEEARVVRVEVDGVAVFTA